MPHDYFAEAERIVKGQTMMLPTINHLRAVFEKLEKLRDDVAAVAVELRAEAVTLIAPEGNKES